MSNIGSLIRTTGNAWNQYAIANAAGGSAGASVAVSVLAQESVLPPSGQYAVSVQLSQDATYYVTGQSFAGFTVNIQPRLAANTLAAGTFNVQLTW
jgi:hypothetical protein